MQTQTTDLPKLLSKQQTAYLLNVSDSTVANYHKQGRLPGIRVGKNLRFSEEQVRKFLTAGSASKNSY